MKFCVAVLLVAAGVHGISAFAPSRPTNTNRAPSRQTQTELYGLFDFNVFHGGGSASNDEELDEQWRLQQEILAARRGTLTKDHLYKKYGHKDGSEMLASQGAERPTPSSPAAESDASNKKKTPPKFFWQK